MRWIDPPEGWKYGFPKRFEPKTEDIDIDAWLLANGYPKSAINIWKGSGVPYRIISDLPISGVDLSDMADQADFKLNETDSEAFAEMLLNPKGPTEALRSLMQSKGGWS